MRIKELDAKKFDPKNEDLMVISANQRTGAVTGHYCLQDVVDYIVKEVEKNDISIIKSEEYITFIKR
jgi:CO dehydrogenase/acetyl-CoA synthase epsilon subunit